MKLLKKKLFRIETSDYDVKFSVIAKNSDDAEILANEFLEEKRVEKHNEVIALGKDPDDSEKKIKIKSITLTFEPVIY